MRESVNIKKLRAHIRMRDEKTLASQLKNCSDQELLELSLNEKTDVVKLLARDPHPESEKQRSRLIRITAPRDRPRLVGAASPPPRHDTTPQAMAWEPASEILDMTWDAVPADEEVTDKEKMHAAASAEEPAGPAPAAPPVPSSAGLDALLAALKEGPSRPQPGVISLRRPGAEKPSPPERLAALESAIEQAAGRPLVIVGLDDDYDETVSALLTDKHARRIVAAVVIGGAPPAPPLPNQVAAQNPVEAGAKLARQGMIDRDGMRSVVTEARGAGMTVVAVEESLKR